MAVGVSGGKDSLTLLSAMAKLREFYPLPFELHAITVHHGECRRWTLLPVAALCRELEVPYHLLQTEIFHIIFDLRRREEPLFHVRQDAPWGHPQRHEGFGAE